MPHANIWIRKEDSELWEKLPNKSEFISRALRGQALSAVYIEETVKRDPTPAPEKEVEEICPGHAMRWNCGRKGCKY